MLTDLSNRARSLLRRFLETPTLIKEIQTNRAASQEHARDLELTRLLTAQLLVQNIRRAGLLEDLKSADFKVFSQFGDDGIIQYLLQRLPGLVPKFVEFGVEDYTESNTRFLLMNDNWQGLIFNGSSEHVRRIQRDPIYWRHSLKAIAAFITRENINRLISQTGFSGQIGILSVDIDGNDYWVWDAINVVQPTVVIIEYNSVFGPDKAVTVPYDPNFYRTKAHYSNLYYGCSLAAANHLAQAKGYKLVGANSAGNNAYFVRDEWLGELKQKSLQECYVCSRFRESRKPNGSLSLLEGADRLRELSEMPLYDVEADRTASVRELYGL